MNSGRNMPAEPKLLSYEIVRENFLSEKLIFAFAESKNETRVYYVGFPTSTNSVTTLSLIAVFKDMSGEHGYTHTLLHLNQS